jgi:glutamyl-tRNA synthetase
MEKPLQELDHHLTLRSFVIGYSATLADFVLWGTIRGNKVLLPNVKRRGGNIFRWFSFIEAANPWMDQVLLNLNESARLKRAALSAAGGSYEIGLDGDNIVTRFPPEPSGYLHIGHAKAALLNDYFAHKNSGGTLICRFDDTNPSKESMEFQDAILSDLAVLGITPDRISYSSDHFQLMYELCLKLISAGNAYADDTELQPMRDQRRDGIPSARRDMSVEETLSHFEEMKSGSETGLKWCIRARISVDDPNKAMRDPVMYRCNLQPHHRTGTTWKMYPTYDFCAPVLDSAEGVTYALRTNEYRDRNAQYAWVQRTLGLREVTIWDFSRLSFVRTVLSKRKLTRLIELGAVSGWDDPRVPTVRGIKRRGLMIPALREFVLKQGPSRNVVNLDWTSIWAVNKKFIDPVASRFTAIEKEATVLTTVRGYSGEPSVEDKPRHAKYSSLGTKKVVYSDTLYLEQQDAQAFKLDEEVTLMNWGNAIVRQIERDPKSDLVAHVELELHLAGDVKQTSKKLTWLSAKGQDLVPVELVEFDHIITKDKLEKEDDISLYINWKSKMSAEALADCNVAGLVVDDIIQFDRKGYYRVDRPYSEGNPAVLFFIPTGRTS